MGEFFKEIKRLPDPKLDRHSFLELVKEERKKCREGVYLITDQGIRVRLHGWTYYHLNHFKIYMDERNTRTGKIERVLGLPPLRDNELLINDALIAAEHYNKGVVEFGSRRLGKTTQEASLITYNATIYRGSQNVIVGNSTEDIKLITSPASIAVENMWEGLKLPHINKDWSKQVVFGIKDKQNNPQVYSEILIRNTSQGTNKEALAGITPFSFVFDEIGKELFLESFEAAKPAFTSSEGGWRCIPLMTGTGGDFEKPRDAKELFTNPVAHNFLECECPGEGRKRGLFISGLYRFDCKKEATFEEFFESEQDRKLFNLPATYELTEIHHTPKLMIADKEFALAEINKELEEAKQSGKPETYLKKKMYYPLNSDDCFLTKNGNPFTDMFEGLAKHRDYLKNYVSPRWVKLTKIGNQISFTDVDPSVKIPIKEFPHKDFEDLDAAIQVWDLPKDGGRYRIEVAGLDPYNQSKTDTSDSLGALYVIRRANNDFEDPFQETMVCAYVARTEKMGTFLNNVQMILEWYNCTLLHENSNELVLKHFDDQFKGHMLMDTWQHAREINPNTKVKTTKGLAPTQKNQEYLISLVRQYFEEEIEMDGVIVPGYKRIKDPLLIDEVMALNERNVDRFWGFAHAVAHLYFTKKEGPSMVVQQAEAQETKKIRNVSTIFKSIHPNRKSAFLS